MAFQQKKRELRRRMTASSDRDSGQICEHVWPIPAVYLLHGKGGSPNGTVKKIEAIFEQHWPGLEFVRPHLPHSDPAVRAERSVDHLLQLQIPRGALLVGISLGGTVAAKLQETGRDDLKVISISSPTAADSVTLERHVCHRLAFYSSRDDVIASRVSGWPQLASFQRDFDWLTHETDQHLKQIVRLFDWYLEGILSERIDRVLLIRSTLAEMDDIVWKTMAEARRDTSSWWEPSRTGGWPRTFTEIGLAMEAGADWEHAWSGWSHALMFGKDARCLAAEPPDWLPPGRRALMAGTAEFLAKLYDLPVPVWTAKREYRLPELDYSNCAISFGEGEYALILPETEADDYRLRGRTPKEMLRRNVIFAARNLTSV
jgi:pimeloyl-ACP methyl ester carboxylesterase